ncbi:MAG TPA: hypothetical protein VNA16_08490 [Abditibacteriaceae bacterium]|nr:hypothetical protein [Abditibacteriaceae bacterium]
MARDEFVDLYEVLGLPVDADADKLRKRINELYLDAQRNLDHRNVQKRLRFQQFYELYLPQARHLLLDPARRAEYDQYLQAYRAHQATGGAGPVAKAPASEKGEPAPSPGDSQEDLTASAQTTVSAQEVVRRAEDEDPEKLAAEREQLWSKWKGSLEQAFREEGTAPAADATPTASTATPHSTQRTTSQAAPGHFPLIDREAVPPAPVVRSQPVVRAPTTHTARTGARPITPAAPAPRTAPAANAGAPSAEALPNHDSSPLAQLHEQERLDLIRSGIETAGVVRGLTVGIVIFFAGCVVIFGLDSYLSHAKQFPFGLARSMFALYFLCATTILALWCGWVASRAARRQASSELSYLSREELLRRNKQ